MIDQLLAQLQAGLQTDIFGGVAAATLLTGAIGFVLFQLRALPGRIMALVRSQFTVTLTVHSDSRVFPQLSLWLARHPDLKRVRRLTVASWWSRAHDREQVELTPGPGRHFLREGGRWFMVERERKEGGQGQNGGGLGSTAIETLIFTTLGRSAASIEKLIADASATDEDGDTLPIHLHGAGQIGRRAKRLLSSIYLEETLKASIIADLDAFMKRRAWYAERGIPYRRGYMLSGPPGTGKSSLIFALASYLNRPVLIVNPATISSDSGLMYALNSNYGAIVVIEDIDSVEILKARPNLAIVERQAAERSRSDNSITEAAPTQPAPAIDRAGGASSASGKAGEGLTLSGFLNAIDGVGAHEGRILFVTSNTPEALDPALMRPGRIDRRYELDRANAAQAAAMFEAFFPGEDSAAFVRLIAADLPIAHAELQNRLLALLDQPNAVHALQAQIGERAAA